MNITTKKENRSFIRILIQILDNQSLQNIVRRNEENNGFMILNQKEFVEKILFQYYKSKKFASFRRSLNSYGFQVHQLQNGQKLFINKNIISINQNIHKSCQKAFIYNYYQQMESEHQLQLFQLTQLKRNQQQIELDIMKILQIQEELTKKMKLIMIQYIQGILYCCISGKKTEQFILQFCLSIQNKQFKKFMKVIFKKALQLPDINYCTITNRFEQNPYYTFVGILEFMNKLNLSIHDFFQVQLFNRILNADDSNNLDKEEDQQSNLSHFFCFNQIEM